MERRQPHAVLPLPAFIRLPGRPDLASAVDLIPPGADRFAPARCGQDGEFEARAATPSSL